MSASQVTAVRRDDNANSTLTEENKIDSENGSKSWVSTVKAVCLGEKVRYGIFIDTQQEKIYAIILLARNKLKKKDVPMPSSSSHIRSKIEDKISQCMKYKIKFF